MYHFFAGAVNVLWVALIGGVWPKAELHTPFYTCFPYEPYYKGHHLRRQYAKISIFPLQVVLDTNRINAKKPIDLCTLRNTGLVSVNPSSMEFGFQLTDALKNPAKWFEKGIPIPKRLLPPQDAVGYYTLAENRGCLADPQEISTHRLVLAQKYGYGSPKIETHPGYEMLTSRKDATQLFYGLEPGCVINPKDQAIIKAKKGAQ